MDIHITLHFDKIFEQDIIPDEAFMQRCCKIALIKNNRPSSISLIVVDSEKMQTINQQYRKKNKPTNVLSFPVQIPNNIPLETKPLGDIFLCPDVIENEAKTQSKSLMAHWAHLLIHGMLHLQGYDHIKPDEANVMESLEINLLKKLGYPDPYRSFNENNT